MKNSISARNPAMDIIRCFALLCVISVHFFINTSYYSSFMTGNRFYLMTLIRCASMICVPLFLLLSGYLLNKKQPDRNYFIKLGKTLSIYFLACVCCYVYAQYLAPNAPGTASVRELIRKTLNYTAAPYAWYIEMYIGLFLLIPYLNLTFHGLKTEKSRRQLVLILMFLSALPGVVNNFTFSDGIAFTGKTGQFDLLIPNYWMLIYPITYYFLGAYLREHPLKLKRSTNLLLILAVFFANGTINFLICKDNYFVQGPWQTWEALPNVIQSALVFNFLAQGNYSKVGPRTCRLLAKLSDCCLGAFLVSWIFDDIFYRILHQYQPALVYQIVYYPLIVPVVWVCSLVLSWVINIVYGLLAKLCTCLFRKKVA